MRRVLAGIEDVEVIEEADSRENSIRSERDAQEGPRREGLLLVGGLTRITKAVSAGGYGDSVLRYAFARTKAQIA